MIAEMLLGVGLDAPPPSLHSCARVLARGGLSCERFASGLDGTPIQWVGDYLAITRPTADHVSPTVYRVQVSGSVGTVIGTTTFHGHFDGVSGAGSWVQGDKIVLTYRPNNVALWSYPAGGKALKVFKGFKGFAHVGLTISE